MGRHSRGVRGLKPGGGPSPTPPPKPMPMPLSSRSSSRCSPRIDMPPPATAEVGTGKEHTRESNISKVAAVRKHSRTAGTYWIIKDPSVSSIGGGEKLTTCCSESRPRVPMQGCFDLFVF